MKTNQTFFWRKLRSPELGNLVAEGAVVLLPVAAVEQHGPHLPVETDSRLAEEICLRTAQRLTDVHPVVIAPTVWFGLSEHHIAYPGTISIRYDTFASILRDVCDTIQRNGFTNIMIVNGHGGNVPALQLLVGELSRELCYSVKALTYCHLADCAADYAEILDDQDNVLHAGEAETSMMMMLEPDRIDKKSMKGAPNAIFDFVSRTDVYRFSRFDELSRTGVNGITRNASKDKGEALLNAGAKAVAEAIKREFFINGQPRV